jgi:hypothetical protein
MGMSLNELLGWKDSNGEILPLTHRQMVMWQEHELAEWNRPSRTDHYLMQIISTLLAVNSKDGKFPDLDKFKIPFSSSSSGSTAEDRNRRDPKFVPPPPGCPRPIRDQKDLDKLVSAQMAFRICATTTSDPSGAPVHPKARKAMKPKYGILE